MIVKIKTKEEKFALLCVGFNQSAAFTQALNPVILMGFRLLNMIANFRLLIEGGTCVSSYLIESFGETYQGFGTAGIPRDGLH